MSLNAIEQMKKKGYLYLNVLWFDNGMYRLRFMSDVKTDFSKILSDLKDAGFNDYKMEELTGVNRSNLTKLRTGKRAQPNYDDGVAIINVYNREVTGA